MKQLFFILGMVLMISGPVFAGSYTVTTTAAQDTALNKLLQQVNIDRVADGKPTITTTQLVSALAKAGADDAISNASGLEAETVRKAYINATQAVKDQVKTTLGIQ